MIKYEIKQNSIEVKHLCDIYEGCSLDQSNQEPQIIESFKTKNDALEALKKYSSSTRQMSGYVLFNEYYIEESEYDEDGEWINGGDILEITMLPSEL